MFRNYCTKHIAPGGAFLVFLIQSVDMRSAIQTQVPQNDFQSKYRHVRKGFQDPLRCTQFR